jgi:hypothetical protein
VAVFLSVSVSGEGPIGYAMAHDHFAPWEVQTVLLCSTVIALATAIISILIGYENL